jgi:dolichol-phosphate mannosyltransferase
VAPVEGKLLALSVVIPTYGERGNLEELITRLSASLQSVLDDRFELIVVDDDSPDGTWKLAAEIAETNPHVRVMRRCQERGLATAVVRGWQIARGDVLAVIDGDLQHPPELVGDLWRLVHVDGADLAIASRHAPGGSPGESSFVRKLISQSLRLVGWIALPSIFGRISDPMSGYFALRRSCIEGKELDPKGYKILIEVLGRGKIIEIRELGYTFSSRNSGVSKATFRVFWEYLVHLAKLSAWRYLRRKK